MGNCPKGGPRGDLVVELVQHCPKKGVGVGSAWHHPKQVVEVGVAQPYPKGELGWVLAQQQYLVQGELTLAGLHQKQPCPDSSLLLLDLHGE